MSEDTKRRDAGYPNLTPTSKPPIANQPPPPGAFNEGSHTGAGASIERREQQPGHYGRRD